MTNGKNSKPIIVSIKNYECLSELGTVTDTFNDVITRLLAVNGKYAAAASAAGK